MPSLPPIKDLDEHRTETFVDLQLTIEELRHRVHGLEGPPRRRDVSHFLHAIDLTMRLIGLDGPGPEGEQQGRADARPSTNGDAHYGPHGQSLWSRVMACPRDDDDPVNPLMTGDDRGER